MTARDKSLMETDKATVSYHDFRRTPLSAQLTVQLGLDHGLTLEQCLAGSGIDVQTLDNPAAEILMDQELVLTRNVVSRLGGVPALGLEAGLRYSLSSFGIWGFALLASSTIRAALDVAMRYHALSFAFSPVVVRQIDGEARLVSTDDDTPEDLRAFCAERQLGCTVRITRELGAQSPMRGLRLRMPRPAHAGRFVEVCGVMPEFGAPDNSHIIDGAWLDTKIVFGNPAVARQVEEQCRKVLERQRHREGMAAKVRDAILHNPTRIPSMETIAGGLCMTVRTLRRKLDDESTSYRELVEEVRQALATELLKKAGMKMDEVAERLGYSDATAFAHAFRRWKGRAPSEFR
jgi:AraC-like DNA-binding protein